MKTTTLAAYPGITFTRVANGEFNCYAGTILTPFKIVNGSHGLTGRNTVNIYGVYTGDGSNVTWLGPLRTAKMFAAAKAKTWAVKKAFDSAMSAGVTVPR